MSPGFLRREEGGEDCQKRSFFFVPGSTWENSCKKNRKKVQDEIRKEEEGGQPRLKKAMMLQGAGGKTTKVEWLTTRNLVAKDRNRIDRSFHQAHELSTKGKRPPISDSGRYRAIRKRKRQTIPGKEK